MRRGTIVLLFCMVLLFSIPFHSIAANLSKEMDMAGQALTAAMKEIGVSKGDNNLLILTNAGYGQVNQQTTEAFFDLFGDISGTSQGKHSLLAVQSSLAEPLWASLFRKDIGKMVFIMWQADGFQSQVIDASPSGILNPEGWKKASSGLIGPKIFSVMSISHTWTVDPDWTLLKAATFHDHFCPGLNYGYIAGRYVMEKLPLGPGDRYMFIVVPSRCAADALQVMFNTTPGKQSVFSMNASEKTLEQYASDGVPPSLIAMRVNNNNNVTNGLVLGLDWGKIFSDTGIKPEEFAPQEGPRNPLFFISRVKVSRELAAMPMEQLFGYLKELKSFDGDASLAMQTAHGDPYATIWQN